METAIRSIYKEIRQMLQSAVPPHVVTINDDYHYEVWAVNKQDGDLQNSEELLGYVAKHDDSVTIGFNNKLDERTKRELFSPLLMALMNGHGRIRIQRMSRQLHDDLQCAIGNLMHYYTEMCWI